MTIKMKRKKIQRNEENEKEGIKLFGSKMIHNFFYFFILFVFLNQIRIL